MSRSRRFLPPLTALPAFEASARLRSFTLAARELNVTQAAISKQIGVLEDRLGVSLFDRTLRRISLTQEGQKFQHSIALALDLVSNTSDELRRQIKINELTVAADISMAHLWYLPKISKFRDEFPDIIVNLIASDLEIDCLADNVDIAMLYGDGSWPGYEAHLLFSEEVFPICTPEYLTNRTKIKTLEDLTDVVLLDLQGERWDWVNWQQWFTDNKVPSDQNLKLLGFNNLPLLIKATCLGQGIGLGWGGLVDDLVNDGVLVKPVKTSIKTDRGYYILRRKGIRISPEAETLYNWCINLHED